MVLRLFQSGEWLENRSYLACSSRDSRRHSMRSGGWDQESQGWQTRKDESVKFATSGPINARR